MRNFNTPLEISSTEFTPNFLEIPSSCPQGGKISKFTQVRSGPDLSGVKFEWRKNHAEGNFESRKFQVKGNSSQVDFKSSKLQVRFK